MIKTTTTKDKSSNDGNDNNAGTGEMVHAQRQGLHGQVRGVADPAHTRRSKRSQVYHRWRGGSLSGGLIEGRGARAGGRGVVVLASTVAGNGHTSRLTQSTAVHAIWIVG